MELPAFAKSSPCFGSRSGSGLTAVGKLEYRSLMSL